MFNCIDPKPVASISISTMSIYKKTQQNNIYFVSIIVAWESEDSSSLHMFDDLHSIFTLVETYIISNQT